MSHTTMSHRRTRITRLAGWALGLTLAALPAAAAESTGYLFDLGEERILALMDTYVGKGNYDRAETLSMMKAPFECRNFGDLCEDIGKEYGYLLLDRTWQLALENVPAKDLLEEAAELYERMADRYIEVAFPDGIDPRDPFLGVDGEGNVEPCTQSVTSDQNAGFRIRQAARAVPLLLGNIQSATTTFFKQNAEGRFEPFPAEYIEVDADFFITGLLAPDRLDRFKAHNNDKRVSVTFPSSFPMHRPHTEACGQVIGPAVLSTCACTGTRPSVYNGL